MAVGLKYHYDVSGAEAIVRDTRVYNVGALEVGTAMASGPVATAENCGAAIVADSNVLSNIIGVLNEDMTAAEALGVVATGVDKYGKIIINPFAVYLGLYSDHADDDNVNTAASTGGKVLTATMVTDHERAWAYVNDNGSSAGGAGNLFQAGSSGGGTTALTAATDYDDNMTTTNTSDTFIVMPAPYGADVAGYGFDLSEATGQISMQLQGLQGTGTGAMLILENYIASGFRPMEPLVCAKHSGYNYKSEDPKFYGDVMFPEHLLAAGGVVNNRVIS